MDPLATNTDLEQRLGRFLTPAETARSAALLGDASALVRAYTRQQFVRVDNDVIVTRPVGTIIRLPQRPVRAVHSVVAVGSDGIPDLLLPGWWWDGIDKVDLFGIDPNIWVSLPEWWRFWWGPGSYRVTYDHGYDEVPPEVVAVVANMVNRTLLSPTMTEGLVSERIGQYSYQFGQGPGGQAPGAAVRLTQDDKDALSNYKRTATTIQTHL